MSLLDNNLCWRGFVRVVSQSYAPPDYFHQVSKHQDNKGENTQHELEKFTD